MALPVAIVPSVLPADQARLGDEVEALAAAGVDRIQWDVMDGCFVPNMTYGPDVIAACRERTTVPFEAQLMVVDPDPMLPRWVEAGCDMVIVHAESTPHLHRSLATVRELGAEVGVALNPATPVASVEHVLDLVDVVLVMTVDPGFGGQAYLPSMARKVRQVRALLDERALDGVHVEVDGGIGPTTIADASAAGADWLVAGSALYRDPDGLAHAVADLRRRAEAAAAG